MAATVGGVLSVEPAAAQARCDTVRGATADSVRSWWRARSGLRDSVRAILADAGDLDPTGAVLVWTDPDASETRMVLVNLDPSREAYFRIRGLLGGFFAGRPAAERTLAIDLDAPSTTLPDGPFRVCACGEAVNDGDLRQKMEKVVRRHRDFGEGRMEVTGRVRVFVDWQGNVLHSVVADSTGDPWFDEALNPLAREMKFEAATVAGTPHGSWRFRDLTFWFH